MNIYALRIRLSAVRYYSSSFKGRFSASSLDRNFNHGVWSATKFGRGDLRQLLHVKESAKRPEDLSLAHVQARGFLNLPALKFEVAFYSNLLHLKKLLKSCGNRDQSKSPALQL